MAINTAMNLVFLPLSIVIFLYFCIICIRKAPLLTNWPLVGMTPGLLKNAHRIHDFVTCLLQQSHHNFQFYGPFQANMDLLFTCDPANVNYILSKNFTNYPKGPEFGKIFDILGEGIFSSDGHLWEVQRRTTLSIFNHAQFYDMLQKTVGEKIEKALIPLLDHVSKHGIEVDLQDILQRLAFDNICSLLLDHDLQSLSLDLPYIPYQKVIPDVEQALLHRHLVPESIWKLQRWIGFSKEKNLSKARETIDEFIYTCISMKRKQVALQNSEHISAELDLSAAYMELAYKENPENPDKFFRDALVNMMVGARDTTSTALSWFFWLLWKNPITESKILQEIKTNFNTEDLKSCNLFKKREEMHKLVYLHAALCESLRLFPPVPFNHKAPKQPDVLPSGHRVGKNSKIVLSFYSMGRMEGIWGKDCLEFKPERWITEKGGIKHEPSYKFTAFNAGPRACLGKDMAFTQMKILATTIIHRYSIQVVAGHPIVPKDSVVLEMKYGLRIRLEKRSEGK
ncbi:hypothetical protein ACET3Z_019250 [Daucus carota]